MIGKTALRLFNVPSVYEIGHEKEAVERRMGHPMGLLFLLPLTIPVFPLKYFAIVVCAAATYAAIQEGYLIRTGEPAGKEGYETTCALRRISDMNEYTAYCGLDCEACQARLATVNNDDALRQRVAREWSELNGVEISAEMINCSGCRAPGVKTPYCDSLCPIRQCAMGKQMETCGECPEMNSCEKLSMITGNNADALRRLKEQE